MSLAKKYGEIDFGEINNNAVTQYSDSFEIYFSSEDQSEKYDFLRKFGSFKFGEINNLMLSDFERALNRYIFE